MIKSLALVIASAAILVFGGCATDHPLPTSLTGSQTQAVEKRQLGSKIETVSYYWQSVGIEVTFCKGDSDTNWEVDVVDGSSIYERPQEQTWGVSASTCSEEQCVELIDQALTQFQTERPGAQFRYVAVQMHVVRELWSEILSALKQKLLTMQGSASLEPCYIPDGIGETLQGVLDKSATISEVRTLLQKHGLTAQHPFIGSTLCFKNSLGGRRWSEIGSLPDAGVELPGVVEFDFDVSSAGQVVNVSPGSENLRRANRL